MKPTSHKKTNLFLGAGDNPDTDGMPITVCNHPEADEGRGGTSMISRWKFTDDEIIKIIETGYIHIGVMGIRHPPIFVFTEDIEEKGYAPYSIDEVNDVLNN